MKLGTLSTLTDILFALIDKGGGGDSGTSGDGSSSSGPCMCPAGSNDFNSWPEYVGVCDEPCLAYTCVNRDTIDAKCLPFPNVGLGFLTIEACEQDCGLSNSSPSGSSDSTGDSSDSTGDSSSACSGEGCKAYTCENCNELVDAESGYPTTDDCLCACLPEGQSKDDACCRANSSNCPSSSSSSSCKIVNWCGDGGCESGCKDEYNFYMQSIGYLIIPPPSEGECILPFMNELGVLASKCEDFDCVDQPSGKRCRRVDGGPYKSMEECCCACGPEAYGGGVPCTAWCGSSSPSGDSSSTAGSSSSSSSGKKYRCLSLTYTCQEDPTGNFDSYEECANSGCEYFNCVDGSCQSVGESGFYKSLGACRSACNSSPSGSSPTSPSSSSPSEEPSSSPSEESSSTCAGQPCNGPNDYCCPPGNSVDGTPYPDGICIECLGSPSGVPSELRVQNGTCECKTCDCDLRPDLGDVVFGEKCVNYCCTTYSFLPYCRGSSSASEEGSSSTCQLNCSQEKYKTKLNSETCECECPSSTSCGTNEEFEETTCQCECIKGYEDCKGTCYKACDPPGPRNPFDCSCTACSSSGSETVSYNGTDYCCQNQCAGGARRAPYRANPCRCCSADCEDLPPPSLEENTIPGCELIVEGETCISCRPCRPNASHIGSPQANLLSAAAGYDCTCVCDGGFEPCAGDNGRCVKSCPRDGGNQATTKLDPDTCQCVCPDEANCPNLPGFGFDCGRDQNCQCIVPFYNSLCQTIIKDQNNKCVVVAKSCPNGQNLIPEGVDGCKCVCNANGLPPDPTNGCPANGPQGPVPKGGGGGNPGGGGPGGGSGTSSGECPANSTIQSDGQCYCNYGYVINSTNDGCVSTSGSSDSSGGGSSDSSGGGGGGGSSGTSGGGSSSSNSSSDLCQGTCGPGECCQPEPFDLFQPYRCVPCSSSSSSPEESSSSSPEESSSSGSSSSSKAGSSTSGGDNGGGAGPNTGSSGSSDQQDPRCLGTCGEDQCCVVIGTTTEDPSSWVWPEGTTTVNPNPENPSEYFAYGCGPCITSSSSSSSSFEIPNNSSSTTIDDCIGCGISSSSESAQSSSSNEPIQISSSSSTQTVALSSSSSSAVDSSSSSSSSLCDPAVYPLTTPLCVETPGYESCSYLSQIYPNGCPKTYACGCVVGGQCVQCPEITESSSSGVASSSSSAVEPQVSSSSSSPSPTTSSSSSSPSPNLVLVYDTSKEPANNTISLPLAGTVNVNVQWGDGTFNNYTTTGFKTHTYASPGVYTVSVSGTMTSLDHGTGTSIQNNKLKLIRCLSFGNLGITNMLRAFRGCINLTEVPDQLPSGVTNCSEMFHSCTSFNDHRVAMWNVSSVTNMQNMFRRCQQFDADLSSWNTASVTGMGNMFYDCQSFNSDLSSWDTGSVLNMSAMFLNADAYDCNMASWNLSSLSTSSGLSNFMSTATGLSTANYDATLVGWNASKAAYRSDLSPNFGGSKYTCGSAAADARAALVAYGWTITDGGCSTPALGDLPKASEEQPTTEAAGKGICSDVICPPGQCCKETVFGFDCNPC